MLSSRVSTPTWALYDCEALAQYHPRRPGGMNSHMLLEDIQHRHYSYRPTLVLDADDRDTAEQFVSKLLIENSPYGRSHADHLFWDFFASVVDELYYFGRCKTELFIGEIEKDEYHHHGGAESTAHPRLSLIPQWSLRRRGSTWLQRTTDLEKPWQDLGAATLIDISLGRRLANDLRRTRRRLVALDANPLDSTGLLTISRSNYDFSVHQRKLDELSARATRNIGWDGRSLFMKRATDSLRVYRALRFTLTWLTMTRVTLDALNATFAMSGSKSAPRAISLEGIPSVSELQDAMQAVVDGSESLDDIKNRLVHPPRA